jgi:hypothetical protein
MAFPANPVEYALLAAAQDPERTGELIDALGDGHVWVPLPAGGGPDSQTLDLPTTQIDGYFYVPVFSSEEQLFKAAGEISYTIAPVREFARGLPPELGIAVNPGGDLGIPIPAEGVMELARIPGAGSMGARVRLREPEQHEESVALLHAAVEEFGATPVVLTARRALGTVENDAPALFIGLELDRWEEQDRAAAMEALGRALGRGGSQWPVTMVLLDVAQDPVGDWMLGHVQPFFVRNL